MPIGGRPRSAFMTHPVGAMAERAGVPAEPQTPAVAALHAKRD